MATLAQIRSRISRKLQDPNNTANSESVVDEEINRAVRYYQSDNFGFNERLININTVQGQQRLTGIPTDLVKELEVGGLILRDDQVRINLIKLHPNDFAERDDDQTGRSYYYTYRDQSYDLLPTPNNVYEIKFRYLQEYADLVNDSDTNDFTEKAEDLLMLHVIAKMYAEDKQDAQLASYYEGLRREELNKLRDRTDSLVGNGYLQSRSILDEIYT